MLAKVFLMACFLSFVLGEEDTFPCGIAHINMERVINGEVVENGKYPWMAYLEAVDKYSCTASIISPRHILTAKHCTAGCLPDCKQTCVGEKCNDCAKKCVVMVGEVNKTSSNGQRVVPLAYHPHEESDASIIELAEPLNFTHSVSPICLAKKFDENHNNIKATVAGWGLIKYYHDCLTELIPGELDGAYTDVLREGTARLMDFDKCASIMRGVQPYEVCAEGLNNTSTFHGDSGGPLMAPAEGPTGRTQWTQIGITSRGPCYTGASDYKPIGSYSRVSYHCDWVAKVTNNEAVCTIDMQKRM